MLRGKGGKRGTSKRRDDGGGTSHILGMEDWLLRLIYHSGIEVVSGYIFLHRVRHRALVAKL